MHCQAGIYYVLLIQCNTICWFEYFHAIEISHVFFPLFSSFVYFFNFLFAYFWFYIHYCQKKWIRDNWLVQRPIYCVRYSNILLILIFRNIKFFFYNVLTPYLKSTVFFPRMTLNLIDTVNLCPVRFKVHLFIIDKIKIKNDCLLFFFVRMPILALSTIFFIHSGCNFIFNHNYF